MQQKDTKRDLLTGLARVPHGPLHGTLVVAFEQQIAGSLASEELARAGATVIKVERPEGDPKRYNSPHTAFNTFNAGKFSVCFNKSQEDQEAKLALLRHADVIIDNRSQAAQKRDEILQKALIEKRNKPIIFCGISGFGQKDSSPAYDRVVQAKTGMTNLNGDALIGFPLIDMATGMEAAKAIAFQLIMIKGLSPEEQKNLGCINLHTSMAATAMALMSNQIAIYRETGSKHSSLVPFDLFDTSDGRISIAIATDLQYAALCRILCTPDIAIYSTSKERLANKIKIEERLREVLPRKATNHWLECFEENNIPAESVNSFEDGISHYAAEMIQPDLDGGEYVGSATFSSLFPRNATIGGAPELNQDRQFIDELLRGIEKRSLKELLIFASDILGEPQERFVYVNLEDIDFTRETCNFPWAEGRIFTAHKRGFISIKPIKAGEVFITKSDEKIRYRNVAKEGDYIATTETGDRYLISQQSLDRNYDPVVGEEVLYQSKPMQLRAIIATQNIQYNAPWGKTAYAPRGSLIVQGANHRVYAVSPKNASFRYEFSPDNEINAHFLDESISSISAQEKLPDVKELNELESAVSNVLPAYSDEGDFSLIKLSSADVAGRGGVRNVA